MSTPNTEQLAVIDNLKDNIILFAGAGTGKTFTVANKVSKILKESIARPDEILCLTFTIKACGEIAEDIERFAGCGGVTVKTIHGFCLSLITEEAIRSGSLYSRPAVIDEVDGEEILQKLVPEVLTSKKFLRFINDNSLSGVLCDLANTDVTYIYPEGFFSRVEKDGKTIFINSEGKILTESEGERLSAATPPYRIVCPDCGKRQKEKSNFCEHCGFDFRTYVKPVNYALKRFRNLVSEVKRHREIYGLYSGDEERDFCATIERLKTDKLDKYEALLSCRKNGGYGVDEQFSQDFSLYGGAAVSQYNKQLVSADKLDFDDLIIGAKRLLKDKEVLNRWKNKYKFIIVDEMQDTSDLEYSVLKNLFGGRVMLCGDISQTIYGWRGSEPFKILGDFKSNFNARTYMLSENYRSTKTLANAAFGYISQSLPQLVGECFSPEIRVFNGNEGDPIRVVECSTERDEAAFIYKYLKKHAEVVASGVCIMSRANRYIAKLCEKLRSFGRSYPPDERLRFFTVDEDQRFYKKPIIKDLLSILSLATDCCDIASAERVCERHVKGVGVGTLSALRRAGRYGLSVSSFLEEDYYNKEDTFDILIEAGAKGNIVVYDTETTGLDVGSDEIVQIAAVRADADGKILEEFNCFVLPEKEISEGALKTHGFSLEYLKGHGAVSAREALIKFSRFASGAALIGHNSAAFDRAVLERQLAEEGLPSIAASAEYDTLALAKMFCHGLKNYKLETLCEKFGIVNERAHDAFADVNATCAVLSRLLKDYIVPTRADRIKLKQKYRAKFIGFYKDYISIKSILESDGALTATDFAIRNFNLFDFYRGATEREAVEDFKEILSSYTKQCGVITGIRSLKNDAALSGSQMDILIKKLDKIPIITVHQSKGCEFNTVIIAGADDFNFPSYAAVKNGNDDEEMRVFYVAISRAKEKLILTYALNTDNRESECSRYVKLIPQEYVKYFSL